MNATSIIDVRATHATFGAPRAMTIQQTRDEMLARAAKVRALGLESAAKAIEDAVARFDSEGGQS